MKESLIEIFRVLFEYHFLIVIIVWLLSYFDDVKNQKRLKKIEKHLGIEEKKGDKK